MLKAKLDTQDLGTCEMATIEIYYRIGDEIFKKEFKYKVENNRVTVF